MTKSDSFKTTATTTPKRLLEGINSPADIKALREHDLPQLAQDVRDELIRVLSQTGGHLGPNLGVVELTIALHRVFNTPRDRLDRKSTRLNSSHLVISYAVFCLKTKK